MRRKILDAARKLIHEENVESISIRKIARLIEYSPATIYHYFDSKEQIVEELITEDYDRMIDALSAHPVAMGPLGEVLKSNIASYINLAIEMGDLYKKVMLSDAPTMLVRSAVLYKGAATERPALAILYHALRELPSLSERSDSDVETIVQVIWSTLFGLSLRMMIEHVNEEQKQRLINQTVELIMNAIEKRGR